MCEIERQQTNNLVSHKCDTKGIRNYQSNSRKVTLVPFKFKNLAGRLAAAPGGSLSPCVNQRGKECVKVPALGYVLFNQWSPEYMNPPVLFDGAFNATC